MKQTIEWKTSETHPLRIDSVSVPETQVRIGMTLCPGKTQSWGRHGTWRRDLDTDLAAIQAWGASTLISLIEDHEFEWLDITALPDKARALGLAWYHWPIRDDDIPDQRFHDCWKEESETVLNQLHTGQSIVLHCMGGLGRTGTVASLMLCEFGLSPEEAVHRVREARPGAIETTGQLSYVLSGGSR